MALRVLRSEVSRAPHSVSGFDVCPLPNLRQSGIAARRGGACARPGLNRRAVARITCFSLRSLPEQILLRKAAVAGRQERSCGLGLLKVFEYQTSTTPILDREVWSSEFLVPHSRTLCNL